MYTVYSLPLHIQEEWTLCRMLSSRRDFITLRRGKYGRHTIRAPTHGLWWWYTWMNEMMTNQNKYRHNERHILTSTKITYSWSTAMTPNVWAVKKMYTLNSRPPRCCACHVALGDTWTAWLAGECSKAEQEGGIEGVKERCRSTFLKESGM